GDAAKHRTTTGGHLLWHQTEPGAEVASLPEDIPHADGRDGSAGDDGPMPGTVVSRWQPGSPASYAFSNLIAWNPGLHCVNASPERFWLRNRPLRHHSGCCDPAIALARIHSARDIGYGQAEIVLVEREHWGRDEGHQHRDRDSTCTHEMG